MSDIYEDSEEKIKTDIEREMKMQMLKTILSDGEEKKK